MGKFRISHRPGRSKRREQISAGATNCFTEIPRFSIFDEMAAALRRRSISLALLLLLSAERGRVIAESVAPKSVEPAPTVELPTIRIRAVGDLAFSWVMGEAIATSDFDPFAALDGALKDADITFANLETVLSEAPAPKGVKGRPGIPLIRGPVRAAGLTRTAGVDVVSVANNHAFDFGAAGLADTLAELKKVGLIAIGGGATAKEAAEPHIATAGGLRVGFLAFAEKSNHPANGKGALAFLPGAKEAIAALRPKVQVLIVSVHWGVQYTLKPTAKQIELAHAFIDAGADAVLGHHPHVLQTVEAYRGRPIFYSLGNFVFGTQPIPRNLSAIAEITINPNLPQDLRVTRATVLPVVLRGDRGSPMLSLGVEGDPVRKRVREASGEKSLVERDGALDLVLTE